jgi:hypothetical protein
MTQHLKFFNNFFFKRGTYNLYLARNVLRAFDSIPNPSVNDTTRKIWKKKSLGGVDERTYNLGYSDFFGIKKEFVVTQQSAL